MVNKVKITAQTFIKIFITGVASLFGASGKLLSLRNKNTQQNAELIKQLQAEVDKISRNSDV